MLKVSFLLKKENIWFTITNFLILNIVAVMRAAVIFITFFVFRNLIAQGLIISTWDTETIIYLVVYASLLIFDPLLITVFNYLFRLQMNRATKTFSQNIYDSFYALNITKSKNLKKEQVLNMVTQDFAQYVQSLVSYVIFFASSIISVIALIVFVGLIDWVLLLSFLGITILIMIFTYVSKVWSNKINVKKSRINEKFLVAVNKKFSVFLMYVNSGYKIPFVSSVLEIIGLRNKQYNLQEDKKVLLGFPSVFLNLFSTLIIFGILWAIFKGTPDASQIAILVIGVTRFPDFAGSFGSLVDSLGSRNQYKKFESKINELYSTFLGATSVNYDKKISTISFENVNFSVDDKQIVSNLNLTINVGDKVLISGPSGAGKSTIISMILNELKPTSGKILINNKQLDENTTIADNISYAYNENFIIDGTLAENITFEKNSNLENPKILELTKKLAIDYVSDLKSNIKTLDLSEGQKQKIVLARALYHDKDLYILDEATSNLDVQTKQSFESVLEKLNKTVIFISHTKLDTSEKIFNKKLTFNDKNEKWELLQS